MDVFPGQIQERKKIPANQKPSNVTLSNAIWDSGVVYKNVDLTQQTENTSINQFYRQWWSVQQTTHSLTLHTDFPHDLFQLQFGVFPMA